MIGSPMEDMILVALLGLAALIVSIVVAAQFSKLKWSVEELKRRVLKLEEQRESRTAAAAAARPIIPTPLSAFLSQPTPTPAPSSPPMATTVPPAINWESIL